MAAQIDVGGAEVVPPNQRVTVRDLAAVTATNAGSSAVAKAAVAIALSGAKVKCDPDSPLEGVLDATAGSSLRALASKVAGASCMTNNRGNRWIAFAGLLSMKQLAKHLPAGDKPHHGAGD